MSAAAAIASTLLAALVAVASLAGLLDPRVYALEHPNWAAQGVGQDAVNVALAVPLLLVATWRARRGSRGAWLVWLGVLIYLAYSYALYAFFVHFGPWFPVYVAALGLSFHLLLGGLLGTDRDALARAFAPRPPVRLTGGLLLALGAAFYALWGSEVAGALLAGTAPASASEIGFAVNPVHVLDMGLLLPATILAGGLLLRRRPLGYLLAAPLLVFLAVMGAAILAMVVVMMQRGFPPAVPVLVAIGLSTALSLVVLVAFLRGLAR